MPNNSQYCGIVNYPFSIELYCTFHYFLFIGTETIKEHIELIHRSKYRCEICDKGFVIKQALDNHTLYNHSSERRTKDYTCEVCGRAFYKINTLKRF